MRTSLEQAVARVRAKSYSSVDALARDLADALGLGTRLQSFRRPTGVVPGRHGSTTMDAGDNGVARTSASMQHPQRGPLSPNGAIATKTQARVELERRTLPGVVVSATNGADTIELHVYVPRGIEPRLTVDPATQQNVATGGVYDGLLAISDQAKAGTLPASALAQLITVTVPRPAAVGGHQPEYTHGQIVPVDTATQYDVRSHLVLADGRRQRVVSRREASVSHAIGTSPAPCCDTGGGGGGGS